MDIREAIRQSNLIENVTDNDEIDQSMLAWNYVMTKPILSEVIVLQTHRLVMTNFPEALPGRYRNCNVMVGGRVCPDYLHVPSMMSNWLYTLENPLDCSPENMHIKFEVIHPFRDGNGQVGRILYWWHQKMVGKPQRMIKYSERELYYSWFE